MTDRAHPVQMNESDLWRDYQRERIATQHLCKVFLSNSRTDERGTTISQSWEASPAELADADLAEYKARYPHRVYDDKEGVK